MSDWRKMAQVITTCSYLLLFNWMLLSTCFATEQGDSASLSHHRLSFNFQDISVRQALRIIADSQNINIAIAHSVEGQLTLRLNQVTGQQALDTIVEMQGLQQQVKQGVVMISPKVPSAALGRDLTTSMIALQYADASELAQVLQGEQGVGLLSERGAVSVDKRTNVILVRDLADNIAAAREMVAMLDVPVKQVQIEARIVTINQGNLEALGVRWGISHSGRHGQVGGTIEDLNLDSASIDQQLNVNLAAQAVNAASIAFQIAKLGSDTLLDLELSALQRESKAEVISSPSLMTTHKQAAFIEQGTEIPYLESSSSGATNVAFKKAVLSLKVTPQITPNNQVILDLNVTQDRPGDVVNTGTGEAVAIDTQRIGTQVLVESGQTIVLGGIFQHSVLESVDKVPLLGDIPLLGGLFRRTYQKIGKRELVVFVTPKVITEFSE
ncbi:type IV pilus secretin PilQ [Vibrio sinaloensis]|uniref:type IV pilus secretin PilQ n=1 Tax=Photobacterium sp. (strain ATCC 43367) TaxID=379097 RepID=UPI00207066AD|nr:type IV pilus secretin PilQ [Vibrio sinaloensis]UPQ88183.1 type IV pilus secretin PilQ [Vibrio sinaloensis]